LRKHEVLGKSAEGTEVSEKEHRFVTKRKIFGKAREVQRFWKKRKKL
jgi:hypothetical protein